MPTINHNEPLDPETTADRQRIIDYVDLAKCEACGTPCPALAEDATQWFMTTFVRDGSEYAQIRCPKCW